MDTSSVLHELNILLVDHDTIDATTVIRALNKRKIPNKIVRAKDGKEALDLIMQNPIPSPYIVLLDLNMPRMNGLEFLEIIRNSSTLEKTVVFVLSTSSDEQDIDNAYKYNVAGYIVKRNIDEGMIKVADFFDDYRRLVKLPDMVAATH